jgi:hypothetical protein
MKASRLLLILALLACNPALAAFRGAVFASTAGVATTLSVPLTFTITNITSASSAVVTFSSAATNNPIGVGSQMTFSGVSGMTGINGLTGTVTAVGTVTAGSSYTATVNINSTGFSSYISGGTMALAMASGDTVMQAISCNGTFTPTTPSGFSAVSGFTTGTIAGSEAGANPGTPYWKTASGADTSESITWTTSRRCTILVLDLSGRATSPFVVTPVTTQALTAVASPVSYSATGLSGTSSGDDWGLIIFAAANDPSGTFTVTPPSGWTDTVNGYTTTDFTPTIGATFLPASSGGSQGTLTGSFAIGGGGLTSGYIAYAFSLAAPGGACTHSGYTSAGAIATPNGSSGSYLGKSGAFVTPDCSTVNYWQPTVGDFGVN